MIYLYNTFTRKKEKFVPLKLNEVGIYSCGPTVYNYAHIGNHRANLFADFLKRMFLYNDFKVTHIMNITDVGHLTSDADEGEDKMEKGARREGKTVWEISQYYADKFKEDLKKLNILPFDEMPKATDHIKEMIETIQKLEKNGHTYQAGGNVYFDVSTFKEYGKMANVNPDDAVARVDKDENKKHHFDFVLWFTKSKFENHAMKWDSPWGTGYPGWHIECSAMSMKYLGDQFDIHTGGADHIPIHHPNEIAQSECATGKKWVNYWMHNEFLVLEKEKMAKSGDNFLTLQVLIDKGYSALDYRYFIFTAHYRKQQTFSWEGLDSAKNARENLNRRIIEIKKADPVEESHIELVDKYKELFRVKLNDDLNIPEALAVMWNIIKDDDLTSKEKLNMVFEFDKVFGLDLENVEEDSFVVPEDVLELIKQREQARQDKNWADADTLREEIKEKGYEISDTPQGPDVKKI